MSHFDVLVMTREGGSSVDELMAPYYEGLACPPRIVYTREQAIAKAREKSPELDEETAWRMTAEGYITDFNGNIYDTGNPFARWDWYSDDAPKLKLKSTGEYVVSAKVKDIDFSPDPERYNRALVYWRVRHESLEKFYRDAEEYARRVSMFKTTAVVTYNGLWVEECNVGWFGISDAEPEKSRDWDENYHKRFIEGVDPETVFTILDCHI